MLQIHFSSYVVIITWLSTKAIKINVDSKMLNVIPKQNSMINNDNEIPIIPTISKMIRKIFSTVIFSAFMNYLHYFTI